jgi:hypothetical protein
MEGDQRARLDDRRRAIIRPDVSADSSPGENAVPHPHVWDPAHEAVWRENAPGTTRAITLRHPNYPYEGPDPGGTIPNDDSDTLINWAATYLRRVSSALGLNAALGLSDIFEPSSWKFVGPARLTWLPVHGTEGVPAPLDRSFWVTRYAQNSTSRIDRTAVIMAVQSRIANDPTQLLGSRLGIRIIAHVSPSTSGPLKAQIAGVTCSIGLPDALALNVPAANSFLQTFFDNDTARSHLKAGIREVAGFGDHYAAFYDGLRVVGASGSNAAIELYLTIHPPSSQPQAPSYAVVATLLTDGAGTLEFPKIEKWPLIAHAMIPVPAKVFTSDLASQEGVGNLIDTRPNRSPKRLMPYLSVRILAGVTFGPFLWVVLHDDRDEVAVKQSTLVNPAANETDDQAVIPGVVNHPRMNWFAAISAYQHARGLLPSGGLARGLFDALHAFGLWPIEYFRFATLPLRVRHRARIDWGGKDGKVVNAQVNFDGLQGDVIANPNPAVPLPIQVKYALADVKRTGSRRQPLGIAADPRWCWHEAGHVLLAASTGALQFRFAHSAGDALAAVLSDPESALATHSRMRGLTFPWVYIHRRHDRSVFRGWSWSGRYHRPASFTTDVNSYPRKGYQSEQILSSSLFRLYRAFGGDTVAGGAPDTAFRRRAADYTGYLIMKAIRFMPQAFLAPLETPDQLVSALIDADRSTLPVASGPLSERVGGWAFKVVRWAFEAQGLFATNNVLDVVDAPGKPKDPDVFIDDRRPHSEGVFTRGGYMPVSLDWQAVPNPPVPEPNPAVVPNPPNPPLWHATADAIRVVGNAVTVVEVSSRGPSPATGVTVQVWWIDWPAGDPPAWNNGNWKLLGTSATQTVAPWPARTQFGPFSASGPNDLPTSPAGRRLLIVATATCAADPANSDTTTTLPCSTLATSIVDLVAGDNNIGLRRHDVP